MTCTTKRDICIVRGDQFGENVALGGDWTEVVANPSAYEVNMVFREAQDDTLTPYLELSATPEVITNDLYALLATLTATAAQTQALPDWNHYYYVELAQTGGLEPIRLYQGKVKIND